MVHIANQRLDGRLPQGKGAALAKFSLPDGQNSVAAVQVTYVESQGLANPHASGVQQAEQRRGRRWP
jgi:hypothetical protein